MIQLYRKEHFTAARWAGGTTTQLLILPPDGSYAERTFWVRLSTATVEQARSTFTPLPGIQRELMVLAGSVVLEHRGHHTAALRPYQSDRFDGGWETVSEGVATDLNLMCQNGATGSLTHLPLTAGSETELGAGEQLALYCAAGSETELGAGEQLALYCAAVCRGELIELWPGDLLYTDEACLLRAAADADLVAARFALPADAGQKRVHRGGDAHV